MIPRFRSLEWNDNGSGWWLVLQDNPLRYSRWWIPRFRKDDTYPDFEPHRAERMNQKLLYLEA